MGELSAAVLILVIFAMAFSAISQIRINQRHRRMNASLTEQVYAALEVAAKWQSISEKNAETIKIYERVYNSERSTGKGAGE